MTPCPICETENRNDATECVECGKKLLEELPPELELEPLEGHQRTEAIGEDMDAAFELASLDTNAIEPVEDLEKTPLFDVHEEVEIEPLALDSVLPDPTDGAAPDAPSYWSAEALLMESGREEDGIAKTPQPPENGPCPWCAFPGDGLVCNNCGRRRTRILRTPDPLALEPNGDTLLCPACFCRVFNGERCSECLAPLPRSELF